MSAKLNLKIACDPFDFVRGMRDGGVSVDGIDLVFQPEMSNAAESGATRTPIPAQGGQHSGDCGQQVMAA